MRIAINCRSFLLKNYTGIGRYAFNLVKSLSSLDTSNTYLLYARKRLFDFKRKLPTFRQNNFHACIDWRGLGPAKALKAVDLYHAPSLELLPTIKAKVVVTVHDLIYKTHPEGHTPETLQATAKQFEQITRRADKIICCSHNTLQDLNRYFSVDPQRTCVIYQGVDKEIFYPLRPAEERKAQQFLEGKNIRGPFLLFVGTIEPRKNLLNLIEAFRLVRQTKAFDGKLVVAGMKGWMQDELLAKMGQEGLVNDIVFLGYLTDFELCVLYNKATVFVFPSFYEGFGFPIVEAFCCGAAVVTSKTSSCGEVAQDAAVQIDPNSPEDIAQGIKKILSDVRFASALKAKALARAQLFSFEETARATWRVYQEVYRS